MKCFRKPQFEQRRKLLSVIIATATVGPRLGWAAGSYPEHVIRMVVPFSPGGTIDLIARYVAAQLGERLSKPVYVETKPGANGVVGTTTVSRSAGDGYTLLLVTGSFVVNPSIYTNLPYDPARDFTPITSVAQATGMLLVNPALPVFSVQDLISLSRSPGEGLNYGSPGVGNTIHLVTELFKHETGAHLTHIPYKGNGPAVLALTSNEVQCMFIPPPIVMPLISEGKLRPIAFTGTERMQELPDVPTMVEEKLPQLTYEGSWIGLFAPSSTPPQIVDTLYSELQPILKGPEMKAWLDSSAAGYLPDGRPPLDFSRQVANDQRRFGEMVRLAGIKPT